MSDPLNLDKLPKFNKMFLPGRMAFVFDTTRKGPDQPESIIRSEIEVSSADREKAEKLLKSDTGESTQDIVINKLIQILSYIRQGHKSKLEKKRKDIEEKEEKTSKFREFKRSDRKRSPSPKREVMRKPAKSRFSRRSPSPRKRERSPRRERSPKRESKKKMKKPESDSDDDIFAGESEYVPDHKKSKAELAREKELAASQGSYFKDATAEIEKSLPTAPESKPLTSEDVMLQATNLIAAKQRANRVGAKEPVEDKFAIPEGAMGFGMVSKDGYGAEYDDDDRMDDESFDTKKSGKMNHKSLANKQWKAVENIIDKKKKK